MTSEDKMDTFLENRSILYVDDEVELLNAFTSLMRKEKYNITTLHDSTLISDVLEKDGPFAVVLSDQRMPGMDGAHVLEVVKEKFPDSIRILVTGFADYKETIQAINLGGINTYISKPWDDEDFKRLTKDWIGQYNLKIHNKFLTRALDEENNKLNEILEGTVAQTVRILGDIANNIAPKVTVFTDKVKTLGKAILNSTPSLSSEEKWEISRALDLFNIGIALLPVSYQASLSRSESLSILNSSPFMTNHHLLAAGLLKEIPRFAPVARIIELQNKDFNGMGEPLNEYIKGEDIPLGARILHILIDLVRPTSSNLRGTERLLQMEHQPLKYDTKLIQHILGKNLGKYSVPAEDELAVNDLLPGMELLEDIRTQQGYLLLKSGLVLTETMINIISQWQKRDPIRGPIKVQNVF